MSDAAAFVKAVVARFEALGPVLAEHVSDHGGEILPHVFFGDLTRYVLSLVAAMKAGGLEPGRQLRALLDFLEESFTTGGEPLQELISVSFLENLPCPGEQSSHVRSMLGPALSDELRRIERV